MPRLLSVRSIYAIVVKTVSGCAGGESISGPKMHSVLALCMPTCVRSLMALNPDHSTGFSECNWEK